MSQNEIRVAFEPLKAFAKEVFVKAGMLSEDAELVADVLVWANLRGVDSHGVLRIPWYVELMDTGQMNPRPNIKILKETAAVLFIEADRSPGPVVTVLAMNQAMERAKQVGIGWGFIRNLTHQGAIGYYTLMAARANMVGIAITCSPPNMAPYGAKAAGVHNSPISIAAPAKRHRPLLLDMATSVAAGGKLNLAIDKGIPIPEGWALDGNGNPTTNPSLAKVLLPIGGPKGSGLALMFECLSSIMVANPLLEPVLLGTGLLSNGGKDLKSAHSRMRGRRHNQNGIVAAIDINTFTDVESYKAHVDTLIDCLKALPKAEGFDEIFVPGELEDNCYDERIQHGIPLPEGTIRNLQKVAERFELKLPW
jgi:LDH2 family malate/lactate/ureidoglycolate dehydrogenase